MKRQKKNENKKNDKEPKYLNVTFNDDTYYVLQNDIVLTNTSEGNIKELEKRFKKVFPRKSTRITLWEEGGEREKDCKCFLSVDLKMVPNGNKVGDIGTMVVDKVNRHKNSMCSVHSGAGTVQKTR